MSRWLGFFVGLAVAITVVLTVVRPRPADEPVATQSAGADQILELPPLRTDLADPPAGAVSEPETVVTGEVMPAPEQAAEAIEPASVVVQEAEDIAAPVAEPIPEFHWDAASETDAETEILAAPEARVTVVQDGPPVEPLAPTAEPEPPGQQDATLSVSVARQWYAFWQPFSSELSARGFSNRLERVTGLDYRVVKVDSGEYHVAFGYDDEEGRLLNLDRIEAATGLSLGGHNL